jgi:ribosomal protein S18 acetylase RimI-like enzyme
MPKNSAQIEYLEKDHDDLEFIRPLWQKLNQHHRAVSKYYKDSRTATTFDMRKKQLLEKSCQGALHIDLARDSNTEEHIGYCVTTINPEKQGEIESLFIEKDYRGMGIGDNLMARALSWLKTMSVQKTILGVAEGNESVFPFYRRYNFYPRVTILWQKTDSESKEHL